MKEGLDRIQEIGKILITHIQEKEQKRSQQSIDECWNNLSKELDSRKKKKHIRLLIRISSVAAILFLLVVVNYFMPNSNQMDGNEITNVLSESDLFNSENDSGEVVLISGGKKITASTDKPQITHTEEGDITIDNMKITTEKIDAKKNIASQQQNCLIVPKGKRSSLTLADGTKMHINSRTKVIYPNVFDADKRVVYVEGEAYFEVTRNDKVPFVVKTADFEVQVLGTKFDVLSYKELGKATITLVEGSVNVTNSQKESIQLKPSECVQVTSGVIGSPKHTNTSAYTSWVQGYYSFEGTPLKDVMEKISFYFDKDIILDKKIQNLSISGNLDINLSLDEIFQNLSSMLELIFTEQEGKIYVSKNG